MTKRPTQLADVTELSNVLRAMDEWESAGGDLDSAHGRRRFVDGLGDDAADELAGLALTTLARRVFEAQKVAAGETGRPSRDSRPAGETGRPGRDSRPAAPDLGTWPRNEHRRAAA